MRVLVRKWLVAMRVRMWLAGRRISIMFMRVVHMAMFVLHRLMRMVMLVGFCEMEIQPDRHQQARRDKSQRDGFAEHGDGQQRPDKGSRREIRARARCAEKAEGVYEQHKAHTVTEETDQPRIEQGMKAGKMRAGRQLQREVHASGHKPLDERNL